MKKSILLIHLLIAASAVADMAGGFDNRAGKGYPAIGAPIYTADNTFYNFLNSAWGAMHIYDNQVYQNAWGSDPAVNFSAWFKTGQGTYYTGGFFDRRKHWGTATSQCAGALLVGISDQDLICRAPNTIKSQNCYLLIAKPGQNIWYLLNGKKGELANSLQFIGVQEHMNIVSAPQVQGLSRFGLNGSAGTFPMDRAGLSSRPTFGSFPVLFRTASYDATNPDFVAKGDSTSWAARANRGLIYVVPQGVGCNDPSIFEPLFGSDVNGDLVNPSTRILALSWNKDFQVNALKSQADPLVMFDDIRAIWKGAIQLTAAYTASTKNVTWHGDITPALDAQWSVYKQEVATGAEVEFVPDVSLVIGGTISLPRSQAVVSFTESTHVTLGGVGYDVITQDSMTAASYNLLVSNLSTKIKAKTGKAPDDMMILSSSGGYSAAYKLPLSTAWSSMIYNESTNSLKTVVVDSIKSGGFGVTSIASGTRKCCLAAPLSPNGGYASGIIGDKVGFLGYNSNFNPASSVNSSGIAFKNTGAGVSRPLRLSRDYGEAKVGDWVPLVSPSGANLDLISILNWPPVDKSRYWGSSMMDTYQDGYYEGLFIWADVGGAMEDVTQYLTFNALVFGRVAGIDSPYWRAVSGVKSKTGWPNLSQSVYRVPSVDVGGTIADSSPEGEVFPKGSVVIAIPKIVSASSERDSSSVFSTALFVSSLFSGPSALTTSMYLNNEYSSSINPGTWGDYGVHNQVFMDFALDASSVFEPFVLDAKRNGR